MCAPRREESKWLVKGLLNTAAGDVLSQWPLCNDMVRKCFLWPSDRDTATRKQMPHLLMYSKCNYNRDDRRFEVLVSNFKKDVQ